MKNVIGIRREDLSKTGEKRVAISPELAEIITAAGHRLIVQSGVHPKTGEIKRAFIDHYYKNAGAEISEDLSPSNVIFGLKEVDSDKVLPGKTYFLFSHTHKGQKKNRKMLELFIKNSCTVIDYELITNESGSRLITAFTYMAGKAGMIDSLWTLGWRLKNQGIENPFSVIPQSIEKEDLGKIREKVKEAGEKIFATGTPAHLPPVITLFLGDGKTSIGAQEIYNLLPVKKITPDEVEEIFRNGSRQFIYKVVLDIPGMYQLNNEGKKHSAVYDIWPSEEKRGLYLKHPELFESAVGKILPFCTLVMNCIIWAPKFPRVITNSLAAEAYSQGTLKVIGDISCDPNGGIEFSKETWIDHPVYIFNPQGGTFSDDVSTEGIAVMAVANLPCEFSMDSSLQFSQNMEPFIPQILKGNYEGSLENSGLPAEIRNACILWRGEFTKNYSYMKQFVEKV